MYIKLLGGITKFSSSRMRYNLIVCILLLLATRPVHGLYKVLMFFRERYSLTQLTPDNVHANICSVCKLAHQGPSHARSPAFELDKVDVRGFGFSELLSHWKLPLDVTNFVAAVCTGPGTHDIVCTCHNMKAYFNKNTENISYV